MHTGDSSTFRDFERWSNVGFAVLVFISILSYCRRNDEMRFLSAALVSGIFLQCNITPFFDPNMKLFGVLANLLVAIGAIVGGVIGILLPKVSTGFTLGTLLSLLLSLIYRHSGTYNSDMVISGLFLTIVPLSIAAAFKFERKCADVRSALAVGLSLAIAADSLAKKTFLDNVFVVLSFTPPSMPPCTHGCYFMQLVALWAVGTVLCLLRTSGSVLKSLCGNNGGNYIPLSAPSAAMEDVAPSCFKQRTFSYPDTLVWNYVDPDEVPELLRPHAENIFTIAQAVMQQHGFQVDNSRNQCEHLLMLLFNETSSSDRMVSTPALRIHRRMFMNYRKWCDSLSVRPLLLKHLSPVKSHEALVEDLLLLLMIWGEAANLRHLPECLCFLFHKTMEEHLRSKGVQMYSQSNRYPGFYLDMVITPIYEVVAASMAKSVDHAEKKIYDDFNEFFWSPNCLKCRLHEVVEGEDPAVKRPSHARDSSQNLATALRNASKSYLEKRSWFHPLLAVNRVFEWHVVTFTLLATWSFSTLLDWTYAFTLQAGSFVFWEITFLGLLWACLEVWTLFPSANMTTPSVCGFLIRILAGFLILTYQSIYFHWSFITAVDTERSGSASVQYFTEGGPMFWWWQYVWLSLLSCSLYFLQSIACWFPAIVSWFMTSKSDALQSVMSVMYPIAQLFVGKATNVPQRDVYRYIAFWLPLLAFKLWFGYNYIVSPVCVPTLQLYDDYMNFTTASFTKTSLLIFFWWFPHFLVYIIDMSIWYAVWSSVIGGFVSINKRLGAVRDSHSYRQHFTRAALLFEQKFMPHVPSQSVSTSSSRRENVVNSGAGSASSASASLPSHLSTMSFSELTMGPTSVSPVNLPSEHTPLLAGSAAASRAKSTADLENYQHHTLDGLRDSLAQTVDSRRNQGHPDSGTTAGRRWVLFGRIWNEIVAQLRANDHINNKERDWLLFTSFEWLTKPIYLPIFQTAGGVELAAIAYHEASKALAVEDDKNLKMQIIETFHAVTLTSTVQSAVMEAWELAAWVLAELLGNAHTEDCAVIMSLLSQWGSNADLLSNMSGDQVQGIIKHLTNIVSTLVVLAPKRRSNPVVSHDMPLTNQPTTAPNATPNAAPASIKKSVSTGFLSALEGELSASAPRPNKYAKLQPFRKCAELVDTQREKLRDELKSVFGLLRTAIKATVTPLSLGLSVQHGEAQTLSKSITFILSLENGFFSSDAYASKSLDLLCKDTRALPALQKLEGLLKLRITQVELRSHEAKRRLHCFMNSLYMDVPPIPNMRFCKEYTTITPYYSEDILLTKSDLLTMNSDKVSVMLYLQTLYKDDWSNFLERRGISRDESLVWSPAHLQELRMWASLRAQTLFRTVEGMMANEAAVRLLAELEAIYLPGDVDLLSKLKFNYVVACQVYGMFKTNLDSKADDIDFLLQRHPNLRVAYIDAHRHQQEVSYYSVLIKASPEDKDKQRGERVKEVFRVKLPGNPVLGEGKPENQNHAIIFTRGRYLQAIDMNQDGYFEEALKMRNLLEEFGAKPDCAVLGFREHIFTGSVSSVANYMALQELSFVTLGQRVLNELSIRQHYGHPDLFDKFFVMTEGGMSKASRGINLSEDVFAGFNATIRGHSINFAEYVTVGKGRDVGLQQTYKFEAKLAQGNAEQSLSRDVDRICNRLDFFRLLSFYYGGIGHYLSNALVMFTLVIVVYTMLAQAVYQEEGVNGRAVLPEGVLQLALAGMGILQTLPLAVTLTVEKGFRQAISEIGFMILSGGPLYFIFHIQTKSYYFSQTLLAGGAMYRPTGRGFVTQHAPFDDNFRFFASSHIYLGFELCVALVLFAIYTQSTQYAGLTWSLWLAAVSFLFGPFWFNPLSFEWSRVTDDYYAWLRWMEETGGSSEQSWDVWWREENSFLPKLSSSWKIFLVVQKCALWVFIAVGLAGRRLTSSSREQALVTEMLALVAVFVAVKWVVGKLEKHLTYPVRRFVSLFLSSAVGGTLAYLFATHVHAPLYTVAGYYLFSAAAFLALLTGHHALVLPLYKLHDYVVGHAIFLLLAVASAAQLGYVQTWLLYQNALSKGIEIEDILQYARRTKEKAGSDSEAVQELRAKVVAQEKRILELVELASRGPVAATAAAPPPAHATFYQNSAHGSAQGDFLFQQPVHFPARK